MVFSVPFLVVLFIVLATVRFKMHLAFLLALAAVAFGFLLCLSPKEVMATIGEGFGRILSDIGLVIGIYLEKMGVTWVLANSILGSAEAFKQAGAIVLITGAGFFHSDHHYWPL